MSQHTPGPWRWRGDSFSDEPHRCPHPTEWCDHGPNLMGAKDATVIVSYGYDSSGLDVSSADARLIAAAPEMYEFIRRIESGEPFGIASPATAARALLAKINGATVDERGE